MNSTAPDGHGLFYVMGPSGSGKDSLLRALRERLKPADPVVIAHRYITRAADANEASVALTAEEFHRRMELGCLALHWHSHGLHYGIGVEIEQWLASEVAKEHVDMAQALRRCAASDAAAAPLHLAHAQTHLFCARPSACAWPRSSRSATTCSAWEINAAEGSFHPAQLAMLQAHIAPSPSDGLTMPLQRLIKNRDQADSLVGRMRRSVADRLTP